MKNLNKRTTGGQMWPRKGTFDLACCEEVEKNNKHHEAKDKSDKREGK